MSVPQFEKVTVAEVVNEGQINTFSAVGDINQDGRPDIVISGRNGRFVWLENPGERGTWPQHLISDARGMECGGSVVDLTGNGCPDIFFGEIGHGPTFEEHPPELILWENRAGRFTRDTIDVGTGIHDAVLADVDGDGRLDIVGKPLQGPERYHVHVYFNRG